MTAPGHLRIILLVAAALLLNACASLQRRDPLQVIVAGIEPMQGQGLELRMLVKLRIQNPNDAAIDFNGVSLKLDVQGKTFATGVSDERGSVPRFGEAVVSVPVTASAMRMAHQAMGMLGGKDTGKIRYSLSGKLNGPTFSAVQFQTEGEFELPTAPPAAGSET